MPAITWCSVFLLSLLQYLNLHTEPPLSSVVMELNVSRLPEVYHDILHLILDLSTALQGIKSEMTSNQKSETSAGGDCRRVSPRWSTVGCDAASVVVGTTWWLDFSCYKRSTEATSCQPHSGCRLPLLATDIYALVIRSQIDKKRSSEFFFIDLD